MMKPCEEGKLCIHETFDYQENCIVCNIDFDGEHCPYIKSWGGIDIRETTEEVKDSIDYLTGMKHISNAVIYELKRLRDYYKEKEEKESTIYGIEYYSIFGEGIDKAIDVVENTIYTQLMEKEKND